MKLPKIYGFLKKDMESIESALQDSIQANHPVLRDASTELLHAGGKRIRPVFVLLSSQLGNYDLSKISKVAVTLELIHMATLVHDDVIDEAELRRGKPTTASIYGNRVAMYTGDYILARALEEITDIPDSRVHQLLSKTLVEVSIGEIEQIEYKFNWEQNLRDYLRRIKRKTALLIASSCKLGAIVGGLNDYQANKLYQYGYYIGMSYQIIDDILDFTSTSKELGKPAGNDLLQGNITLPVLYAMEDKTFKQSLFDVFTKDGHVTTNEMKMLIQQLKRTDAIKRSYVVSDMYLSKALTALDELPSSRAKKTLQDIATYIGKRRS
ncbi:MULTISPECIES: heptaprenyl diphosphate synthase component II [Oceanobacillus]|uniref:Heptaprenyl diphosphate synthase component 2 n=1 Tax=Oceanobacillus kimchii TaxID=746691 RepID=A0ABQ5THU4_9BACI|nr:MULTISPECIES: heptaprenyl diphosphate synthase component II [Oceanobacillus]MBT2598460.1 heptaprenyl diphosphate synthase component II [Oceanobacillus sp. ISL-74]MBT2651378.1 heptaprenyl diphosphate synthase component II [Oceanobacillus sp. ISL-73]MCT1576037.1 heptaprenyl diphosphate synthase component II [Oceanobacillus kimchii]MCT2135674.1 heptaprenyl diphosphate synthase component II [Oceanobacillus kimchii]GLO66443.1 heptaprenyl diphosphate synthase component 2 [Oceanobacillus kimchii]